MARKTANSMKAAQPVADVIELSSDSEPEAVETKPQKTPAPEKTPQEKPGLPENCVQPLLKVVGIKYKTDKTEEKPQEAPVSTPTGSKMTLRTRGTGSAKHKHVGIEIPLPSSSMLRRKAGGEDESGNESGNEVFKTPMERRHITFNGSDQEDFATPSEAPKENPLELQIDGEAVKEDTAKEEVDEGEEEEESDDEAPEAVSTRAAEVQSTKAAESAAKAIEEKEAADKRKRQERDARLKQQAKERKQVKKPVVEADSDSDMEEPAPAPAEKRKREVPKLLPLEFLESDDEEEDIAHEDDSANSKRRKINGVDPKLLREPKLPRDQRVGETVYRVAVNKDSGKLAPKAKKQSMNAKQALLIRGRTAKKTTGFRRR
ncbi:hypothetical protein QBC40DRAFT_216966 [Triangularia verruculosa]|uniref:Uncharacterized protein n=1 Tax=Triangularia verruculosa TaxID=2587418 RepID=A0AAN6XP46_9PEZI|nr:hypothetical protein QBC40DRAFT_216966 [Triangularia verruculosa]